MLSATVEQMKSTLVSDVAFSLFDIDDISEEQRFKICLRMMQIVPEMDIQLIERAPIRSSKFYTVAPLKDNPKQFIVQAFDCRSDPEIRIHISDDKNGHALFAIIKESETKKRPIFDIMGYELLPVISIKPHEPNDTAARVAEILGETSSDRPIKVKNAVIDTDKQLTKNNRFELCEQAMKVVSGRNVEFMGEITGSRLYYSIKIEIEWIENFDLIEAFICPTKPIVYLHIHGRSEGENIVWVIVQEKDFEYLTSGFEK